MKLKNKETGEIVEVITGDTFEVGGIQIRSLKRDPQIVRYYPSLAELNEEWEDYEVPKGIQCIYYVNHFDAAKLDGVIVGFETKEEAEKAVEKLKAWKRLKDKGFRFNGWNGTQIGSNISYISEIYYEGCADDMDLLFGGEE